MAPERRKGHDPALIAGSIVGIREWRTDSLLRTLFSGATRAHWNAEGAPTRAVCPREDCGRHRPPGRDCTCGLYAWHPRTLPRAMARRISSLSTRKVVGVIEAWGQIELHPFGFRAQFARPVAFINQDWPDPTPYEERQARVTYEYRLLELAERCGAELIDPSEGESVMEWLRRDGRYLAADTLLSLLRGNDSDTPIR